MARVERVAKTRLQMQGGAKSCLLGYIKNFHIHPTSNGELKEKQEMT